MDRKYTVILLAAQRAGVVNPLAAAHAVSHKCLVPISGAPLISHVLRTLADTPDVARVQISVERDVWDDIWPIVKACRRAGQPIEFVESNSNIAASVLTAAEGCEGPFIVTTADNVLLTSGALQSMMEVLDRADIAAAFAPERAVKAVHEQAQRRFYRFRDDAYSNCNLYGLANARALRAAGIFREGGQFMKNPKRLINAFGLLNIVMFRAGLFTLPQSMRRIAKRFGLKGEALIFRDGSLAVDVDNERTHAIAEPLLSQRLLANAA